MTSATAKSSEPTIDDILASIRRIIADDQQTDAAPTPPREAVKIAEQDPDDVLDLAQPMMRPVPATKPTPLQTPQAVNDAVVAAIRPRPAEPEPVLPPKAPAVVPAAAALKPAASTAAPKEGERLQRLIAGEAEEALSAAFGRIAALKVSTETKTLDGLVADLLRPLLKEWLDANLPAITERLVKQEIERISAQSGR